MLIVIDAPGTRVHAHLVVSAGDRLPERSFGRRCKLPGGSELVVCHGDADPHGHVPLALAWKPQEFVTGHGGANLVRDELGADVVGFRQQERKTLGVVSAADVVHAKNAAEDGGDL